MNRLLQNTIETRQEPTKTVQILFVRILTNPVSVMTEHKDSLKDAHLSLGAHWKKVQRTIADKSDAAYIASRSATHVLCTQIRQCHRGIQNPRDEHLQRAMDALDVVGPGLDVTRMLPDDITQSLLNGKITQHNMTNWRNKASPSERVHLQAYSAKGGGHEVFCRAVQDA